MSDQEKDDEELREKRVEYYAASVNAWFNSRLEFDKSLLTLSSAGIGLLVALLSALAIRSATTLLLYEAAVLAFLVCLGAVLWAIRRSTDHLEAVNSGEDAADPLLGALDRIAVVSFFFGVVFSAGLGVTAAINSLTKQEESMKDISQVQAPQAQGDLGKSLNNPGKMQPVAPQPAAPPPAPPPAQPQAQPKK